MYPEMPDSSQIGRSIRLGRLIFRRVDWNLILPVEPPPEVDQLAPVGAEGKLFWSLRPGFDDGFFADRALHGNYFFFSELLRSLGAGGGGLAGAGFDSFAAGAAVESFESVLVSLEVPPLSALAALL